MQFAQAMTQSEVVQLFTKLSLLCQERDRGEYGRQPVEKLVSDPGAREELLRHAARSGDVDIRSLAYRLLRVDVEALFPDQAGHAGASANRESREVSSGREKQRSVVWPVLVALLGGGLLVSLGVQFYPMVEQVLGGVQVVSKAITQDTRWTSNRTYILDRNIYVEGGAKLFIEPGTRVLGRAGSALVVTRDATIEARGTADHPIVFTSAKPEGGRLRGDWGGVVLLGNAPINRGIEAQIEGVPVTDVRGAFGGSDIDSNCGALEYVRIEFAGYEVYPDNELNGLTLGGCGKQTTIRHIQVHKSLDDGIEVFGGAVNLKHVVITGAKDDSFDWDMGWTGKVQFLVIQQHIEGGDNGFEGDNFKSDPDAIPRSLPSFYNVTMVGANNSQVSQRAMHLRRGSGGVFGNFIVVGFSREAVDLDGLAVASLVDSGQLDFREMLFYQIGKNGVTYFVPEAGSDNDDSGFDEASYFSDPLLQNRFGLDPRLPPSVFNPVEPDFTPFNHSPARVSSLTIPQDEFWDEGANYMGAIRPGSVTTWLDGWTAYPAN